MPRSRFILSLAVGLAAIASSPAVATDRQESRELEDCPVKLSVSCTSTDGREECNSIPKLDDDCETNVLYKYSLEVTGEGSDGESLKFVSLVRKRRESYLNGKVHKYLKNMKAVEFHRGTTFTAEEDVCEDTRGDTKLKAKFYMDGKICSVAAFHEDEVWTPGDGSSFNRAGPSVEQKPVWVEDTVYDSSKELLVLGEEPDSTTFSSSSPSSPRAILTLFAVCTSVVATALLFAM